MFSRAPVKRFNDNISETPGPDTYNVKELASTGILSLLFQGTFIIDVNQLGGRKGTCWEPSSMSDASGMLSSTRPG